MANGGLYSAGLRRFDRGGRVRGLVSVNNGSARFVLGSELGALCLEGGNAIVVGRLWTHARHHADITSEVIP